MEDRIQNPSLTHCTQTAERQKVTDSLHTDGTETESHKQRQNTRSELTLDRRCVVEQFPPSQKPSILQGSSLIRKANNSECFRSP